MDSSTRQSYQIQNNQHNSGLLHFRSVPSTVLSNSKDSHDSGINKGGFDSERLISIFMDPSSGGDGGIEEKSGKEAPINYGETQQSYMDSSYELLGMDHHSQGKPVTVSLMRQSSSLPVLCSDLSVHNGYGSMKGLGNYCGVNDINGELSPSSNRLKNQISFSSRQPSSLSMLSRISEIGKESIGPNSDEAGLHGTGFHYGSWNDSANFTEKFSGLKRTLDNDQSKFFPSNQNADVISRVHVLSHLSLPKTSNEMVATEKFLHFQDSVPCKMRLKRGCATHPRSIAERQTNTADMLDLAVEYIKDLQKQFKTLSDNRANCKCLNNQKLVPNQIV